MVRFSMCCSVSVAALLLAGSLVAQEEAAKEAPKADAPKTEQPAAEKPADTKAEDKPADAKAADKTEPAAKPELKLPIVDAEADAVDPVEAWKKATARRLEIFAQLQKLKQDFEKAASKDDQRRIRDEFTDLIREFEIELYPQMLTLAAKIYEKNPEDLDAGEITMRQAFNENQFDKAAAIADKLLAADRQSKDVLNMAAVSHFAQHDFEKSVAIFAQAAKLNRTNPRYDSYAEAAARYGDLWKKEQELRAKEEALQGDTALPRAQFETDRGNIVIELFEDQAPNTVANFISLIEGGKYKGIAFHRVIPGFMAQGGDPNTLNEDPLDDGLGGPGYSIACECYRPDARLHFSGSLSMAHAGKDSGGSQFFITHLPTDWLNPRTEPVEGGHTVFGRVVEGLDIARTLKQGDRIKNATVLRKRPHEYKPVIKGDDKPAAEEKSEDKTEEKKPESTTEKPADEKKPTE